MVRPGVRFRSTTGPIRVTGGRLLLVNYETLTMAAQFDEVMLPEPHLADLLFDVPNGDYTVEVNQLADPDGRPDDRGPDFVVLLIAGGTADVWTTLPWAQFGDI